MKEPALHALWLPQSLSKETHHSFRIRFSWPARERGVNSWQIIDLVNFWPSLSWAIPPKLWINGGFLLTKTVIEKKIIYTCIICFFSLAFNLAMTANIQLFFNCWNTTTGENIKSLHCHFLWQDLIILVINGKKVEQVMNMFKLLTLMRSGDHSKENEKLREILVRVKNINKLGVIVRFVPLGKCVLHSQ